MTSFLAMRRGVQIFLRLPTRDREAALSMGGTAIALGAPGRRGVLRAAAQTPHMVAEVNDQLRTGCLLFMPAGDRSGDAT